MNLTQSTLAQQLCALRSKEVSSVELATDQLARAGAFNPTLTPLFRSKKTVQWHRLNWQISNDRTVQKHPC